MGHVYTLLTDTKLHSMVGINCVESNTLKVVEDFFLLWK